MKILRKEKTTKKVNKQQDATSGAIERCVSSVNLYFLEFGMSQITVGGRNSSPFIR